MKKRIFLSTIILAMLGCVAFVSCSKDDKDEGGNKPGKLAVTGSVIETGDTWAEVEGYVNNTDKEGNITRAVKEYGVEYSLADGSGTEKTKKAKGISDNKFTVKIEGLTSETKYQYRTYVIPDDPEAPETIYGSFKTFTTGKKAENPNVLDITSGEITAAGIYFNGLYYSFSGSNASVVKADNTITDVKLPLKVKYDGTTYDLTSISDQAFSGCKLLKNITFTFAITSIGKGAFSSCESLETIELPSALKEIKDNTFAFCSKLKTVNFPSTLETIGDGAFYDCSLTQLNMPSSVKSIGKRCFGECNFEEISLSSSLKEIPEKAFVNCYSLKSVRIPNSVTKLGDCAFMYCYLLGEVRLSESVEEIGEYCFQDAYALTYIFIPKGVKTIGGAAFQRCNKLTRVDISYGIKKIDSYAFYDTPKNITMQITASTPPTLGTEVFKEINTYDNQRTLMVPASYLSAYNNATWKAYFRTIKASNYSQYNQ